MRKKLLLFAILFIILSLPVRTLSQGDEKVDALIRKGWVVGRGEEDYALDETITRAEFTRMVVLLEEKNFKGISTESPFLDVKKDAWFAPYIEEAARKQWVVGDGDGRFRPNDHITYAEVFAILTRLQDSGISKGKPWYANYVANAEKWGYTRGIDIKDYRHKALRRHVFDGIYNVLESREKAEKIHDKKIYPTLILEFEKTEKTPEKRDIPKVNEEKIHKIKLVDGDKIREINALHGKTIDKPNAEQREGYIFVGWFNGEEAFDFDKPITSDINLTAKFEPKVYTVKFTDGDEVIKSRVEHGKTVEKPSDPVKEGYNFVGWFNGEETFDFETPIISDLSLTAKFDPVKVTVQVVDEEQNVLIEPKTIPYGSEYTLPTIEKSGFQLKFHSDNMSYSANMKVAIFKDTTFIARYPEKVRINIWSDDGVGGLPSDREKSLMVHSNSVFEGRPIPKRWIPNSFLREDRYPLRYYDPKTGRISPESYDLEKPLTGRTCLISISKANPYKVVFLDIKPDEKFDLKDLDTSVNQFYRRIEAKRIQDIPESNAKLEGYHTDGWREVDKTERFEFDINMVSARGKVFVPYWVKDE